MVKITKNLVEASKFYDKWNILINSVQNNIVVKEIGHKFALYRNYTNISF